MSINQYPSDFSSQTHLWPHYYMMMHQSSENNSSSYNSYTNLPSTTTPTTAAMYRHPNTFNLNNEDTEEQLEIPKEPLFEKPLTPSDVGKLNRLVIPKQHAERYFPLNGSGGGDCSEKGLLLSFEDEVGKSWRFRYSYWNSSQSYVLTKGWSRFVKEKKLDAGDVVLFFRHRGDAGRLFIGWRRKSSTGQESGVGGGRWNRSSSVYPYSKQNQGGSMIQQQQQQPHHHHQCLNEGSILQNQTLSANGTPKKLRLFGVNLECHVADESEPSTPEGSPMSSQGEPHQLYYPYYQQYYSNNYSHMDINFSGGGGDVYRQ